MMGSLGNAAEAGKNPLVLVVDDSRHTGYHIAECLQVRGYDPAAVKSQSDALNAVQNEPYRTVLVNRNLGMPAVTELFLATRRLPSAPAFCVYDPEDNGELTVENWSERGSLPYFRVGQAILVDPAEVVARMERMGAQA